MSKLTGLVVLLGGVGILAYAMPSNDHEGQLAQITKIGTQQATAQVAASKPPAAVAAVQNNDGPRTFSPQQPLLKQRTPVTEVGSLVDTPRATASPAASAGTGPRLASSRPADDDAKRELVRDLQKELKRVGCYEGEVSGTWTPSSRKAMSAFTDRVNATLPVDDPDYILLTLVQGHSAQACGKGCPAGQTAGSDGRCLPNSFVTAQAQRRIANKNDAKTASARRPVERRVAVAPASSGWTTTTAVTARHTAQPETPAAVARIESTPTPAIVAAAPLPGRMTVGAATGANTASLLSKPLASGAATAGETKGPRTPIVTDTAAIDDKPQPAERERPRVKTALAARNAGADQDADEEASPPPRRPTRAEPSRPAAASAFVVRRPSPPPGYVYRAPVTRYYVPPPQQQPQTSTFATYSSGGRNWKSAIFNDITRMR